MKRILFLFPILLATVGASDAGLGRKKYELLPSDGPTATASFPKGHLRLSIMRGDSQYYGVMRGDTCQSAQKITVYGAGIGGNTTEKSLPIEAGHKVRILAAVQKQTYGGYRRELFSTCTGTAEFTPDAGKTYLITQEADSASPSFCAVAVTEQQSGTAPGDLVSMPGPKCHF